MEPSGWQESMGGDDAILTFYRGGRDARGRIFDEILAWDDRELEDVHDYIQWLFPTAKASAFNPMAPLLGKATIEAMKGEKALRDRLLAALSRMLRFYGFDLIDRDGRPSVVRASSWEARRESWLTPGDHNLLRITRILDCLTTVGLEGHARAFLAALEALDDAERRAIGPVTFGFWRQAARAR